MTDVHIHIERGEYTKAWIDKFAEQAVKIGLDEIYLLEHTHRFPEFSEMYGKIREYNEYQRNWLGRKFKSAFSDYIKLVNDMRKENFPIKIKWGLEVCYFPEYEGFIRDIIGGFDFDFVTGSVHYVDGFGFDHRDNYEEKRDVDKLYGRYYEIMLQLCESGLFTGLAHPDSIKCHWEEPKNMTATYREAARHLVKNGMYAEQSGGLALNFGDYELGMNERLLNVMIEEGVEIRLASDAHKPEDVGANLREMAEGLRLRGVVI